MQGGSRVGLRLDSWTQSSGSRENRSSKLPRLTHSKLTLAVRSRAGEGDQGQIVRRYGEVLSKKLTLWLGSRGTSDWDGQRIDVESAEGEEGESGFGEHDDRDRREREEMITAPGLKFGR